MAKAVKPAEVKRTAKKAKPKKVVSSNTGTRTIKYEDKSPGQPGLLNIYNELREILLQYVKGTIKVYADSGGQLQLYSKKDIEVRSKKLPEMYFAGLLVQKGYVGFYLMPVYTDGHLTSQIAPELLKCLKGKSCFHIKKLDSVLKQQVQHALQAGYGCFEKKGWV